MRMAITGGIGSGKSYLCRMLLARGIAVYDCDDAAKRLMCSSAAIRRQLISLIGDDAYRNDEGTTSGQDASPTPSWHLNKGAVAKFLLASEANKRAINGVVHPAVADDFLNSGTEWMECALLFESGFNRLVDKVVAVSAPYELRLKRVVQRDGISAEKAAQWINRQMAQEEVVRRADYVIVNDGVRDVGSQLDKILEEIRDRQKH